MAINSSEALLASSEMVVTSVLTISSVHAVSSQLAGTSSIVLSNFFNGSAPVDSSVTLLPSPDLCVTDVLNVPSPFAETGPIVLSIFLDDTHGWECSALAGSLVMVGTPPLEPTASLPPRRLLSATSKPAEQGGITSSLSPALIGIIAAIAALVLIVGIFVGAVVYRHWRNQATEPEPTQDEPVTFTEHRAEELECENPLAASDSVSLGGPEFASDTDEHVKLL
jgi:hypothetical protein